MDRYLWGGYRQVKNAGRVNDYNKIPSQEGFYNEKKKSLSNFSDPVFIVIL